MSLARTILATITTVTTVTMPALAHAYCVCVARPMNLTAGPNAHIVQGNGFLRPDAESAALHRCERLNAPNAGCRVTACTQYEL